MLDAAAIDLIARSVSVGRFATPRVERVFSRPGVDSDGQDAIRITVVLKPGGAEEMTGDDAIDLLVDLQRALTKAGDERFPLIQYATELELEQAGEGGEFDPEDDED